MKFFRSRLGDIRFLTVQFKEWTLGFTFAPLRPPTPRIVPSAGRVWFTDDYRIYIASLCTGAYVFTLTATYSKRTAPTQRLPDIDPDVTDW